MASNVKLGPNFFANELRVYRDWGLAFWRENFQNSVDAGAKNIHVTTTPISDSVIRVVFEDDGGGMTREILEKVYFVLGETSKDFGGSTNTGGYGKARILTCFAQNNYELHTNNLIVKGCGSEYSIEDSPTFQKGVKLIIDVNINRGYPVDIMEKLKLYLFYSYLPCKVFVNGARWTLWTYCRNHRRSLTFGEVYTNNSMLPGVVVRVNGTLMFMRHSTAETQVILEIHPGMSRSVLLANRDGLVDQFQNELDSFITEIQIDKKSAFRPRKNKSYSFNGTGTFKARKKQSNTPTKANFNPDNVTAQLSALKDAAFCPPKVDSHKRGIETEMDSIDTYHNIFDILVDDDDVRNTSIRKVIERYYPSNWDFKGEERIHRGEYKNIRKGVENFKLVKMWKVACEEVIADLLEQPDTPQEVSWGVGFVFSERAGARHKEVNQTHFLLLNPVDDDGTMKYSISKRDDLVTMVTLAVHEVCHMIHSYHDEDFAGLMTNLTARVMARLSDIINLMKEAKEGV